MSGCNSSNDTFIYGNNSTSTSNHVNPRINLNNTRTNLNGNHQASNPQVDNGFVNLNSSKNQTEMSSQLTRSSSRTALFARQRRAILEQLSCFLCKGYLIDATTIGECMDSFCKLCIVIHLRCNNSCPKCGALIEKADPYKSIRSDKVLQDIVYKLVPGLYDNEMQRRREFYRRLYGSSYSSSDDDDDSSSSTSSEPISGLTGEKYGVVSHPKPFYKPSDNIDISIGPQTRGDRSTIYYDNKQQSIITSFTGSLQQKEPPSSSVFSCVDVKHFKTYLRCPARLTVIQLKKFIAAKFNTCRNDTIHLLYLNESLKDEYSLIDVAYIYDWRGIEHMRLFYIIQRDLSKMSIKHNHEPYRPTKTRQSVGISTQTVKRVRIDPQPKCYEIVDETNAETNSVDHCMSLRVTRNMQSRVPALTSNTMIATTRRLAETGSTEKNSQQSNLSKTTPVGQSSKAFNRCDTSSQVNEQKPRSTKLNPSGSVLKVNMNISTINKSTSKEKFRQVASASSLNQQSIPHLQGINIVTERGGRLKERGNSSGSRFTGSKSCINSFKPGPASSRSTSSTAKGPVTRNSSLIQRELTAGFSQAKRLVKSATMNSNHSITRDSAVPRQQIKIKPVYKAYVDVTKLKSPNLKKLGFPSKH